MNLGGKTLQERDKTHMLQSHYTLCNAGVALWTRRYPARTQPSSLVTLGIYSGGPYDPPRPYNVQLAGIQGTEL